MRFVSFPSLTLISLIYSLLFDSLRANILEFKICQSSQEVPLLVENQMRQLEVDEDLDKSKQVDLPLMSMLNLHYDTELYFGKSKKPFKLIIDTGSSALWIPEVDCTNCKENNLWKMFDCKQSSTCIEPDTRENINIEYGIGKVSGYAVTDDVYLSDKDQTGFSYQFILVNEVADFKMPQVQGVVGLGRDEKSEFNEQTILGIMKKNNLIESRVFSLFLSDSSCLGNSVLVLGGYNQIYAQEKIKFIPVDTDNLWSVSVLMGSLAGRKPGIVTTNFNDENFAKSAVIDSGTTKIVLPKANLFSIIGHLIDYFNLNCDPERRIVGENQQILSIVCTESDYMAYPTLKLQLGTAENNITVELEPEDYIDGCSYSLQVKKCSLKFLYISNIDFIILGDTFMRKYYTVFDMDNNRIGFAKAAARDPKHIFESSLFHAYAVLITLVVAMVMFVAACHVIESKKSLNDQQEFKNNSRFDSPNLTTENEELSSRHHAPKLEMTSKTDPNFSNDPNEDLSEEISADDINDLDNTKPNNLTIAPQTVTKRK